MKKLTLTLFGNPDVDIREVETDDTKEIIADKKRYPFLAQKIAVLHVFYGVDKYILHNPQNYKYDGATIPLGLGKGNPKYLTPSLFHDLMCQDKSIIGYNRYLSSLILFKLLLMHHVFAPWAFIMFLCVDVYQRTQRGWKR